MRGESYRHAAELLNRHNGGKPYARGKVPAEHIKAVADRMRARCAATGSRVSMHVASETEYRQLNGIDLGQNSNPKLNVTSRARLFARMLDSFHVDNAAAEHKFIRTYYPPHKLNGVLNTRYGREIRVERAWHIEFKVAGIPAVLGS